MSEEPSARLLVACHKPYWTPADSLYLAVQAGAACAEQRLEGMAHDDDSDNDLDNISRSNPRYSELTVLFWGWRNLAGDALGLVHYRRHFAGAGERGTMTMAEARRLLAEVPVIVPTRRHYVIETIASHYAHTHDAAHVDAWRAAVAAVSPERLEAYDRHMGATSGHMYNMALMRREVLDPYCAWLFDVLGEAERRIDFTGMTPFRERCVGRLGEFLLDVWLESERLAYREVRTRELEPRHLARRAAAFLGAKVLHRPYEQSF